MLEIDFRKTVKIRHSVGKHDRGLLYPFIIFALFYLDSASEGVKLVHF